MKHGWTAFLIYLCCVIATLGIICYSTYIHFNESFPLVFGMSLITAGVAGICTRAAVKADAEIQQHGSILNLLLGLVACYGVFVHIAMSREISAARHSAIERHAEEDRADKRAKEADARDAIRDERKRQMWAEEKALNDSKRKLATAEAVRNESQYRLGYRVGSARVPVKLPGAQTGAGADAQATSAPLDLPSQRITTIGAGDGPEKSKPLTVEDVYKKWDGQVTFVTFVDSVIAIVGGLSLKIHQAWINPNPSGRSQRQNVAPRQTPHMQPPISQPATARHQQNPQGANQNF